MSKSPVSDLARRAAAGYLNQLRTHELRTKAITAGVLNLLGEVLSRHFAGVPSKPVSKDAPLWKRLLAWSKINSKAVKLGLYGLLVSAPMGHLLVTTMHKIFANKIRAGIQWPMICTSMLVIAPLQIATYLASLAVIEGAKTKQQVAKTVKAAFLPVLLVTWISSPPSLAFAQAVFPREFEMPFFNVVQFATGTFFNTRALIAKEQAKKDEKRR